MRGIQTSCNISDLVRSDGRWLAVLGDGEAGCGEVAQELFLGRVVVVEGTVAHLAQVRVRGQCVRMRHFDLLRGLQTDLVEKGRRQEGSSEVDDGLSALQTGVVNGVMILCEGL